MFVWKDQKYTKKRLGLAYFLINLFDQFKPGGARESWIAPRPPKDGIVDGRELVVVVEACDPMEENVVDDDEDIGNRPG